MFHVIVNANSTICNSKQESNNTCQCECKNDRKCKEDLCICQNSKYSKSVTDTSVTECDEMIIVMNNL